MMVLLQDIHSDFSGYSRLAEISDQLGQLCLTDVHVDFSRCGWFDANMSAPLGVVLSRTQDDLNSVHIQNLKADVETILTKNQFLVGFGYQQRPDTYGTTIPYCRFTPKDDRLFAQYLNKLFKSSALPKMSEALIQRFKNSILEIFVNAATHSETALGIFACGQYYPKQHRLDFSIADAGIGIRRKILKELGLKFNSDKAIEWALGEGNTTKTGNIPGGLGLKLLREFVTFNRGRLQIVSDRGYWELNAGNETLKRMDKAFPGTVVNIEINTSDPASYRLSSESET